MKLTIAAILLASLFAAHASDYRSKVVDYACEKPYRSVDGVAFDLTKAFQTARKYAEGGGLYLPESSDWQLLSGKVTQSMKAGFLLRWYKGDTMEGDYELVFVRNYPFQIVDDQRVHLFAYRVGTQSYKTVLGAEKTVELYDFGNEPTEEQLASMRKKAAQQAAAAAQYRAEIRAQMEAAARDKKDKADAATIKFIRQQAEGGSALYQFRLGEKYLKGDGVDVDLAQARRWLRAAAASGSEDASAMLKQHPEVQ